MTDSPDKRIEGALLQIRTPEHRDGFWDDLDARLDNEAVVPLRRKPRYGPRQRFLSVAAAVMLVGGVAAGLALRDAPDRGTVITDQPGTPAATKPKDDSVDTRTATADGVVLQWIEAVGRGDSDAAAELVGPRSRRYIESLGGNVEGFMTESQEGHGAWAVSPDRSTTEVDLGEINGEDVTIVVVSGTWTGEGDQGFQTQAYPAVRSSSGWRIEPFAFPGEPGGRLEITAPEGDQDVAPDSVISAAAEGSGDFYFSLNDNPVVRVGGVRQGGGTTASWDPPGRLAAQSHLLVVGYVDGDTITAIAETFRVR